MTEKKRVSKSASGKGVKNYSPEQNLKRLAKTKILPNFVKENNGSWGHEEWLGLCATIEAKGYAPTDFDQVGLMLEEHKVKYQM